MNYPIGWFKRCLRSASYNEHPICHDDVNQGISRKVSCAELVSLFNHAVNEPFANDAERSKDVVFGQQKSRNKSGFMGQAGLKLDHGASRYH
jgi:hypothetical protein